MAVVENKTQQASAGRAKIPISMRLKAWWDGNELMLRRKALAESTGQDVAEIPKRELDRVTLLQAIWGEGLSDPGNAEFILNLVKPLGLDPSMTVVHLGAGLGAPARTMVEHFGCWVQGLESSKELAKRASELSEMAGMAKKAEIIYFDPARHVYRSGTADCVLSKEFFCKIQDKEHILQNAHTLLKDRGQFLFTDYVLADDVQVKDQDDASKSGPRANHFWTAKRYESYLEKHKFDVRINEDITDDFRKLITNAWSNFIRSGVIETLAPNSARKVLREAEFWTYRMRAIEEGSLKVQRLYAIKKFSSATPMTDWS